MGRKFILRAVPLVVFLALALFYYIKPKPYEEIPCNQQSSALIPPRTMMKSEERIANVQKLCKTRPKVVWENMTKRQRKILGKQIIVNDEHKLLYCFIPKIACANWKRVMMVLSGQAVTSESIGKVNHQNFQLLSDFSPQEIELRLKTYFKFVFIREPLERLVSAYKDKFLTGIEIFINQWGSWIVKNYRTDSKNTNNIPTLTEFVNYLIKDSRMDAHWMSYMDLCQPCLVDYNFIGSFDCLAKDAEILLNKLNLKHLVQFPQKQKYYHKMKKKNNGSIDDYLSQVPRELLKELVHKYTEDYQMFSYPLPTL